MDKGHFGELTSELLSMLMSHLAAGEKAASDPRLCCNTLGPGLAFQPAEVCCPSPTLHVASQSWAVQQVRCLVGAGTALALHLSALPASTMQRGRQEPT